MQGGAAGEPSVEGDLRESLVLSEGEGQRSNVVKVVQRNRETKAIECRWTGSNA